jgi:transposase-like protein
MTRTEGRLSTTHCPRCRSIEFRGVGVRNATERAIRWLLQPYRCSLCGHHFFLFRWQAPLGGTA